MTEKIKFIKQPTGEEIQNAINDMDTISLLRQSAKELDRIEEIDLKEYVSDKRTLETIMICLILFRAMGRRLTEIMDVITEGQKIELQEIYE